MVNFRRRLPFTTCKRVLSQVRMILNVINLLTVLLVEMDLTELVPSRKFAPNASLRGNVTESMKALHPWADSGLV